MSTFDAVISALGGEKSELFKTAEVPETRETICFRFEPQKACAVPRKTATRKTFSFGTNSSRRKVPKKELIESQAGDPK